MVISVVQLVIIQLRRIEIAVYDQRKQELVVQQIERDLTFGLEKRQERIY